MSNAQSRLFGQKHNGLRVPNAIPAKGILLGHRRPDSEPDPAESDPARPVPVEPSPVELSPPYVLEFLAWLPRNIANDPA